MPDGKPDLEDRVETLETGQQTIVSKLDELLGRGHAAAQQHEEQRLGRPSEMQDMVRMELARAEKEKAAAAEKDGEKSERQTIREQLAKLTEAKPVQPQPRRQRVMWGRQ